MLEQRRTLVMQLFKEKGLFPTSQATSEFQVSFSPAWRSVHDGDAGAGIDGLT